MNENEKRTGGMTANDYYSVAINNDIQVNIIPYSLRSFYNESVREAIANAYYIIVKTDSEIKNYESFLKRLNNESFYKVDSNGIPEYPSYIVSFERSFTGIWNHIFIIESRIEYLKYCCQNNIRAHGIDENHYLSGSFYIEELANCCNKFAGLESDKIIEVLKGDNFTDGYKTIIGYLNKSLQKWKKLSNKYVDVFNNVCKEKEIRDRIVRIVRSRTLMALE